MDDTGTHPPIGLAAALDVALALPGCASQDAGERALGDRMAETFFARLTTENHREAAFYSELLAALWGASVALVETRTSSASKLAEATATVAKSREALDRLAGIGHLGASGWLARIGGLLAGFSLTQVIAELAEHEEDVTVVVNESGALVREIEVAVVSEMREPEFALLFGFSLIVAIASAVAVGVGLRWYRRRRVAALTEQLERANCEQSAEASAQRERIVSRLVRTLVVVMERHYAGAAAREIASVTGIPVTTAELLDGSRENAIASFAAQHIATDPLCAAAIG